MSFIYSLSANWNNASQVFTGIGIDVSNGSGGSPVYNTGSMLLNLKNNGTSKFSVDPNGNVTAAGTIANSLPIVNLTGPTTYNLTSADKYKIFACDCTVTDITFNADASVFSDGQWFYILKSDNHGNQIFFNGTIHGQVFNTFPINDEGNMLQFVSIAGVWQIMGVGGINRFLCKMALSGEHTPGTTGTWNKGDDGRWYRYVTSSFGNMTSTLAPTPTYLPHGGIWSAWGQHLGVDASTAHTTMNYVSVLPSAGETIDSASAGYKMEDYGDITFNINDGSSNYKGIHFKKVHHAPISLVTNPEFKAYEGATGATSFADTASLYASGWKIFTQTANVTVARITNPTDDVVYALEINQANAAAQKFGIAFIVPSQDSIKMRGRFVSARCFFEATVNTTSNVWEAAVESWNGTADSLPADLFNDWTSQSIAPGGILNRTTMDIVDHQLWQWSFAGAGVWTQANHYPNIPMVGQVPTNCNNLVFIMWTRDQFAQNSLLRLAKCWLHAGAEYDWQRLLSQNYVTENLSSRMVFTSDGKWGFNGTPANAKYEFIDSSSARLEMRETTGNRRVGLISDSIGGCQMGTFSLDNVQIVNQNSMVQTYDSNNAYINSNFLSPFSDAVSGIGNTAKLWLHLGIKPRTFASLPSGGNVTKGFLAYVTDSNTATYNATVTNGGANNIYVQWDGIQWRAA